MANKYDKNQYSTAYQGTVTPLVRQTKLTLRTGCFRIWSTEKSSEVDDVGGEGSWLLTVWCEAGGVASVYVTGDTGEPLVTGVAGSSPTGGITAATGESTWEGFTIEAAFCLMTAGLIRGLTRSWGFLGVSGNFLSLLLSTVKVEKFVHDIERNIN